MQITAYKCPVTGQLFEDLAAYNAHQQELAQQQALLSQQDALEADVLRTLKALRSSASLSELCLNWVEHYNASTQLALFNNKSKRKRQPSLLKSLKVVGEVGIRPPQGAYSYNMRWTDDGLLMVMRFEAELDNPLIANQASPWEFNSFFQCNGGSTAKTKSSFSGKLALDEFPALKKQLHRAHALQQTIGSWQLDFDAKLSETLEEDALSESLRAKLSVATDRLLSLEQECNSLRAQLKSRKEELQSELSANMPEPPSKELQELLHSLHLQSVQG